MCSQAVMIEARQHIAHTDAHGTRVHDRSFKEYTEKPNSYLHGRLYMACFLYSFRCIPLMRLQ